MSEKDLYEKYYHDKEGTKLVYGNDDWWVCMKNHKPIGEKLFQMGMHFETDEIFVLTEGKAHLVTSEEDPVTKKHRFRVDEMEKSVVYNVPKNVWHYVITNEDTRMIIVEANGTSTENGKSFYVTKEQYDEIMAEI